MATSKNEFIIGLGGVGGLSIQAFRRTCKERHADYERLVGKSWDGKFEYLYIDSNDDVLNKAGWTVYGENIKLLPDDIIKLKGDAGENKISELSKRSNISPWIGNMTKHLVNNREMTEEEADSQLTGIEGAGQLRRFGRILFACNAQKIADKLDAKIQRLIEGRGNEKRINFRIFCTLGGGTGSGSLIDMITLIINVAKPKAVDARIYLYPFIAGDCGKMADSGSFYENEYAALRDINALMIGKYKPYMAGIYADPKQGNDFSPADNKCVRQVFLSTDLAPNSPKIQGQIEHMTKACFETIVYSSGLVEETKCLKALSGEDIVDNKPAEPISSPLRSYRFSCFGTRRWCVPTDQIRDLLKHTCEVEIMTRWLQGAESETSRNYGDLMSLRFDNHNSEVFKFIEKKKEDLLAPLRAEKRSIEENHKRETELLSNIREISNQMRSATAGLLQNTSVMAKIRPCYEKDAAQLYETILSQLDDSLKWKITTEETWGLIDIKNFLEAYKEEIAKWPEAAVPGLPDNSTTNDDPIEARMKAREAEWEKLGFLTIHLTSLDEKMIKWQIQDAESRVEEAFLPFRKKIISNLCNCLSEKLLILQNSVDSAIKDLETQRQSAQDKIRDIRSDLDDNTKAGYGDMYALDKSNLEAVIKAMLARKEDFSEAMQKCYNDVWKSEVKSLDEYSRDRLDSLCRKASDLLYATSAEIHTKAISTSGSKLKSVLVADIIERLEQIAGKEYDETRYDERLGDEMRSFLKHIGCSITFVDRNTGLSTRGGQSPFGALLFGFPASAKSKPICKWLKENFPLNIGDEVPHNQAFIDTYYHESDHEIRVMYVPFWFPARMASITKHIFDKYKEACQSEDGDRLMYFANIDDNHIELNSPNRPALTTSGDADVTFATDIDIACSFFVRNGDRKEPIVVQTSSGIKFLQKLETRGNHTVALYTKDPYPESMKLLPSDLFRSEFNAALKLAKESMTAEDKQAVIQMYTEQMLKENPISDDYAELQDKCDTAQKLLGLA